MEKMEADPRMLEESGMRIWRISLLYLEEEGGRRHSPIRSSPMEPPRRLGRMRRRVWSYCCCGSGRRARRARQISKGGRGNRVGSGDGNREGERYCSGGDE